MNESCFQTSRVAEKNISTQCKDQRDYETHYVTPE